MSVKRWASWAAAALLGAVGALVWAQPAQALVPDRFGFALWSSGVVSQAAPAGTTVSPIVPGRWQVKFPGQGIAGGVVHVTAVHDALAAPNGRFCQAERWGPDAAVPPNEIVQVACYRTVGVLDPLPGFSVQFSASSGVVAGGFYGYQYNNSACGILASYSSVGFATTCFHAGPGQYSVSFIGMGTAGPQDGGIQVTAVNPAAAARCKVASWQSSPNGQFFRILCHNHFGVLTDNAFTTTYQFRRSLYGPAFPPQRFGYLWNAPGAGPIGTNFNSLLGPGANAIALVGPPLWVVRYPALAVAAPGNAQTTAFGANPNFCGLHKPWSPSGTDVIVSVNCFDNFGNPANSGFTNSFSSRA